MNNAQKIFLVAALILATPIMLIPAVVAVAICAVLYLIADMVCYIVGDKPHDPTKGPLR